jgi:LPPG:FO 2-phospho-L-lactate transferase
VHRRTDVAIRAVQVRGIETAQPAPGVIDAINSADLIVFCPSNPFVSIGPILQVPGIHDAIQRARGRGALAAGISPLIGAATVKGPAARMLVELGHEPSAAGVAGIYQGLLDVWLIDRIDGERLSARISAYGMRPVVADALMRHRRGEGRLARVLLRACLTGHRAADRPV